MSVFPFVEDAFYLLFVLGLAGSMSKFRFHKDQKIRQLDYELPQVILQDLAQNTAKRYSSSLTKWISWARCKKIVSLPAQQDYFALFLILHIKTSNSVSPCNSLLSAVSWAHRKLGFISPTEHDLCKQIIQAGRRMLGRIPINRKLPLAQMYIRKLFERYSEGSLDKLQILCLIVLGFFAFLRWDDLSQWRVSDIHLRSDHAAVFLEKRKNDQYREGSKVLVARCIPFCPVSLIEKFLCMGGHKADSPLFRKICHTKGGFSLRSQKFSYTRALEEVRAMLKSIGLDPLKYGLHSMRSGGGGGASLAAAIGIHDRLIMRHGVWKSESSKNRFIKEATESLLSVFKALRL